MPEGGGPTGPSRLIEEDALVGRHSVTLPIGTDRGAELRRLADTRDPQACRELAAWLLRTDQADELRIRSAGGDRYARWRLADWLVGQRRFTEAIQEMRQLAASEGGAAQVRLARLLAGRGRVEEAIEAVRKLPAGHAALRRVPAWLASQGHVNQLCRLARTGNRQAVRELIRIGRRRWRAGQLTQAVEALTAIHDVDIDEEIESRALAEITGMVWRPETRFPRREQAIDLLSTSERRLCRWTRARLLVLQNRCDEAMAEFRALAAGGVESADRELATLLGAPQPVYAIPVFDPTEPGYPCAVSFSPDGTLLATAGGNDHRVRLSNAATGECLRTLAGTGAVGTVVFAAVGTLLATNADLWNPAAGEIVRTVPSVGRSPYTLAFSPEATLLATTTDLWHTASGEHVRGLRGADAVAFSPDGTLLATGARHNRDKGVRLWCPITGDHVRDLQGPADVLAFSPDGTLLATALRYSQHRIVRLWCPATGDHVRDIAAHANAVAFSPDGTLLATATPSRMAGAGVRLWNPVTGEFVRTIGSRCAEALAFGPDGTLIAALSTVDGIVRLWRLPGLK